MNDARKRGLSGMGLFGFFGAAIYVKSVYFPDETSGFCLTFVLFIFLFCFLLSTIQFISGEDQS